MPSNKVHQALSYQRTGKTYALLHSFIDKAHGVNHREVNHAYNSQLKQTIFNNYGGQEAVEEWIFHIILDNLFTLTLKEKLPVTFSFSFTKNGYVDFKQLPIL